MFETTSCCNLTSRYLAQSGFCLGVCNYGELSIFSKQQQSSLLVSLSYAASMCVCVLYCHIYLRTCFSCLWRVNRIYCSIMLLTHLYTKVVPWGSRPGLTYLLMWKWRTDSVYLCYILHLFSLFTLLLPPYWLFVVPLIMRKLESALYELTLTSWNLTSSRNSSSRQNMLSFHSFLHLEKSQKVSMFSVMMKVLRLSNTSILDTPSFQNTCTFFS